MEPTDKQQKVIDEFIAVVKKLKTVGIGIDSMDGSVALYDVKAWDKDLKKAGDIVKHARIHNLPIVSRSENDHLQSENYIIYTLT